MSTTPLSTPPAMYRCGIVIVTVLSVVFGEDVQPAESSSTEMSLLPTTSAENGSLSMSSFCFQGTIPSGSCRLKCSLRNQEPYCDEGQSLCLCTTPEKGEDVIGLSKSPEHTDDKDNHSAVTTEPIQPLTDMKHDTDESEENEHHLVLYIFKLNNLFGEGQEPEDASTTEEAVTQTDISVDQPDVVVADEWNFERLLAVLIILLLANLMVIEIYTFYKKRNSKNRMERTFNTVTIPSPSKA